MMPPIAVVGSGFAPVVDVCQYAAAFLTEN
jgi:hypothetical protein